MSSTDVWHPNEVVPAAGPIARQPSLAVMGETPHVIWCSDRIMYHSYRQAGGWRAPIRVAVGSQPSLGVSGNQLHCLFSNSFAGNYEVYHLLWDGQKWSLPQNVSRTTGSSLYPSLSCGAQDGPLAAWVDATSGSESLYLGQKQQQFWSSLPVPQASGTLPSLARDGSGRVCLAWQARRAATGAFQVLGSIRQGNNWSAPQSISEPEKGIALFPRLAATRQDSWHLVWQQGLGKYQIFYSEHMGRGWSWPERVSEGARDCRQPQIAASPQGYAHVTWFEETRLKHRARRTGAESLWLDAETISALPLETGDVAAAAGAAGYLHVAWTAMDSEGAWQLHYARRDPLLGHSLFLPHV